MELRYYQKEAMDAIEEGWKEFRKQLLVMATGCHDGAQGILMYDGSVKRADQIAIGDRLMGDDGTSRTVLSLNTGEDQMYKVVPVKGTPFIVNGDHILSLSWADEGLQKVVNISVKDYTNTPDDFKRLYKLYHSDKIQQFGEKNNEVTIDPYFFGTLLSGNSIANNVKTRYSDKYLIKCLKTECREHGCEMPKIPAGDLLTQLRALGLFSKDSSKRSIPDIYKLGDSQIRAEVLAGMIDTDGCISLSGQGYDYITYSEALAKDIAFIARSLGLAACIKECSSTNGDSNTCYWMTFIKGRCDTIPSRTMPLSPEKNGKNVLRTGIKEIIPVGQGKYYGWTTDGNHLYLMDDFTITHNCGKTIVFDLLSAYYANQGQRVLIMAHRDELIEQARAKYKNITGQETAKEKGKETSIGSDLPIVVGSVQTLGREKRLNQFPHDYFNTIVVDEAHHTLADSYMRILSHFPYSRVLGVTATPDRGDKRSLAQFYETTAYDYSLKQAIDDGYLCKIKARTIPIKIDMRDVKISKGDFEINSTADALRPCLGEIAASIKKYASDRKTIVFLPLVSIAQEFRDLLLKEGMDAREVNANSIDRKETLEWFNNAEKGSVLCNTLLLTEGYDCPSCDCVVCLRPTKIRSLYAQTVGRGTRLYPGKKDLLLLDFLWLTERHNLCQPADLVTDNAADVKDVKEASENGEVDILDRVRSSRQRLAEEIFRNRDRQEKVINPIRWFECIGDYESADHESVYVWEKDPITDKQRAVLESNGISTIDVDKGTASLVITDIIKRRELGLATPKQMKALIRVGYENVGRWSFDLASEKLTELADVNWDPSRLTIPPGQFIPTL